MQELLSLLSSRILSSSWTNMEKCNTGESQPDIITCGTSQHLKIFCWFHRNLTKTSLFISIISPHCNIVYDESSQAGRNGMKSSVWCCKIIGGIVTVWALSHSLFNEELLFYLSDVAEKIPALMC